MVTLKNNLKKADIVNSIFTDIGISSLYTKKIFNDIIEILITNLVSNKKIKIKNFGTFKLIFKNKRLGRNPKNNEAHFITERAVVSFKAANNLKNKVNKNA
jgi:integration host factor subunit alpha